MPDYALADTSVLSRLTKRSPDADAYNAWRGNRRLAVNDHIIGELLAADFQGTTKQRLDDLLAACVKIPMSGATHVCYAKVAGVRAVLKTTHVEGQGAGDNDVWIIAAALEHGIPLFSHDRHQVGLGRLAGVKVITNISDLSHMNPKLDPDPPTLPPSPPSTTSN